MTLARTHHYLSQFYLALFTKGGKKNSNLVVFDRKRKRCFKSSPRNVATKRDFNRIEINGNKNGIEKALSSCENEAAKVFNVIVKTKSLPSMEEFSWVLNFICLFYIRNPEIRGNFEKSLQSTYYRIGDILGSDPKLLKNILKKSGADKKNVSVIDMMDFLEKRKYDVEISTDYFVRQEFETFNKNLHFLFERHWTFIKTDKKPGYFVTSDRPVTIISQEVSKLPFQPGLGVKNTELLFPLSKEVALLGLFERTLPNKIQAEEWMVADFNGRNCCLGQNQIYSFDERFKFLDKDGVIKTSEHLIE